MGPDSQRSPRSYTVLDTIGSLESWLYVPPILIVYLFLMRILGLVNKNEERAATLLQETYTRLMDSLRPIILEGGWPQEDVDRWVSEAREEIRVMRVHVYIAVSQEIQPALD